MSDYEDVRVTDLVINNISQEKYDELKAAGQLEATQIYLTPTEESGGGSGLPDQTDNEGALLTTDGTNPQWTGFVGYVGDNTFGDKQYAIILDPANKQTSDIKTGYPRIAINPMGDTATLGTNMGGTATGISSVSIGIGSSATNFYTVAVGANAVARGNTSTAVGDGARATNTYSIQLGKGLNDTESTFSVGFGASNNYRLLEADGTIPAERMSSTTGTTGQVLTKTDTGMEWQDASGGAGGLTEVTVGAGLEGNGTSDNPLAIDTTYLDTAISANNTVSTANQEAMNARTEASQALTLAQANEQALANKQDKGDYVSASAEGTGGQLLSILLCSNEAEALELSGTHAGSLCFFPAVTE